jgi:cell wall-active antibiotic response 4TMS protein YvqF
MKCANHPETDSVAFCGLCGRALCNVCKRDVRGMAVCENCLAARVQASPLPPIIGPGSGPNPGLAVLLGLIPGVGAIYNGQVIKAMVQVLMFGALVALSHRVGDALGAIFGLGAFAFYFYMVIDSYQTARAMALGIHREEWFGLGDFKMNAPIGAGLLIVLGAMFLMDNFGIPVFHELGKFWPVLLILLGILLLQKRITASGVTTKRGPEPPPPPSGPPNFPGPQGM